MALIFHFENPKGAVLAKISKFSAKCPENGLFMFKRGVVMKAKSFTMWYQFWYANWCPNATFMTPKGGGGVSKGRNDPENVTNLHGVDNGMGKAFSTSNFP